MYDFNYIKQILKQQQCVDPWYPRDFDINEALAIGVAALNYIEEKGLDEHFKNYFDPLYELNTIDSLDKPTTLEPSCKYQMPCGICEIQHKLCTQLTKEVLNLK